MGAAVAVTGIIATMPYVAVQLISLQAIFRTVGAHGEWPLLISVAVVSLSTFRSGRRAPALLSIAKDVPLVWFVLTALLVVAMYGGWRTTFRGAGAHFAATPSPGDELLLADAGHLGLLSLIVGSALAVFAYPHALLGMLAAKDRATVQRNAAALPVYCLVQAPMALLGFFALAEGVVPLDGDLNTVLSAHSGGTSWPVGGGKSLYIGVLALAANLVVVVLLTLVARALGLPAGRDATRPEDYEADVDDSRMKRLDDLLDGLPRSPLGSHRPSGNHRDRVSSSTG